MALEPDDGPAALPGAPAGLGRGEDLLSRGVEERQNDRRRRDPWVRRRARVELDRYVQPAVPVGRVEAGLDLEIADADLGRGVEIDVALDAGQPPEVLALEIGAVRPAVDLDGQDVLARLEEPGDVELGRRLRVLAEADLLAVDPDVEERLDGAEVEKDVASRPIRRDGERPAVGADRVVVVRHERRLGIAGEFVRTC